MIIWVTLVLCLLAAGAIDAAVRRARPRVRAHRDLHVRPVIALVACGFLPWLLVVEGRGEVPYWDVAPTPIPLEDLPQPVLVLPTSQVLDYQTQLWSARGWPLLVNGGSGFDPTFQVAMREEAAAFPADESVAALQARGVATVVVIRSRVGGTLWEQAADAAHPPDVERADFGDAVVYDLR